MIEILTIDENAFSVNEGVLKVYPKNYYAKSNVNGKVSLVNAYDSSDTITGEYLVSEFTINGVVPTDLNALQIALSGVSFSSAMGGSIALLKSTTGFQTFIDDNYTLANPLVILQGNTEVINVSDGVTVNELPTGVSSFYDPLTSKILPQNINDAYNFTIGFQGTSTSNNGGGTIGFDIGGAFGQIFKRSFRFPRGTGVVHDFYFSSQGYSGATFLANGAIPKIESNVGASSIFNITLQIHRTHRALSSY